MKQRLLLFFLLFNVSFAFAQSPTYEKDSKEVAKAAKDRAVKNGYKSLINFNATNGASFYIYPSKSYLVLYIYDISPNVATDFNAHIMSPDTAIERKYSAIPEDVLVHGTAKVAATRFKTPAFKESKLPVKINANPKAKIYIYYK
ncbi:hypothetical protein [Pinibacter aurantiacus]|uniref:Uncharacterized protein n=1 Tax=Pinibacter aurantiacus TaxID=2851599 RepID=A0A9E2S7U8_9BACT|nr:hypothetical protein [Pinibacter aurantiacus]MBV4356512.1 hypothetical protein [Pinibacter aurantiacus]